MTKRKTPETSPAPTCVPDATMEHFLVACRATLEAAWACADAGSVPMPGVPNPREQVVEAIGALNNAVKSAICADGAEAVAGYAMVARALAAKAGTMRADGQTGAHLADVPFPFRAMLLRPPQ